MPSLIAHNRWRWSQLRAAILVRDGFRCQLCGDPAREVDHIAPRAHGGGDHPGNLRSLCRPCHNARAVKPETVRALFRLYGVPIPPELDQTAELEQIAAPGAGPLRGNLSRR